MNLKRNPVHCVHIAYVGFHYTLIEGKVHFEILDLKAHLVGGGFGRRVGKLDPRQSAGSIVGEPLKVNKLTNSRAEYNDRVDEICDVHLRLELLQQIDDLGLDGHIQGGHRLIADDDVRDEPPEGLPV